MILSKLGLAITALVLVLVMFILAVLFNPREVRRVTVMSSPKVVLTSPYVDILEDYREQMNRMELLKALFSNLNDLVYEGGVLRLEDPEALEEVLIAFQKETGRKPNIEDLGGSVRITDLGIVVVVRK